MKSLKFFGIVFLAQSLWSVPSYAIFIGRGEVPRASIRLGDASPSGRATPDLDRRDSVATPGTRAAHCGPRDSGNYLSLRFLHQIMDYPEDIALRRTDRDSIVLTIPKHISACMDLDFEFRNVGSDKVMAAKNVFRFTPENTGKTAEELERMSHDEKYSACLMEMGLLIDNGDRNFSFDRSKAESENHVVYSSTTEFPLSVSDRSKSMRLFFASPMSHINGAYGPAHQESETGVESPREWPCMATENFMARPPYIYISEEDRLAERTQIACESEDYEQIMRELSELRSSSAGNANELINILESALEEARNKRLEEIYTRMEEIEQAFNPTRDDIAAGRSVGVNETRARSLAREYRDLLEETNRILYDPAIQEINRLTQELEGRGITEARQTQIYDRVSHLNEQIGRFSRRENNLRRVFQGLKEYGLNDEALRIEGFRLKSLHFSRVHPDSGRRIRGERPLTIAQADENIQRTLRTFENNVLTAWENQQRVRAGDATPIRTLERQNATRWSSMQRQYQQFVQREQEDQRRYCAPNFIGGVRNPVACQRFMQGQQQRSRQFQQRWQSGVNSINQNSQTISVLNQQYDQAMREIASLRQGQAGGMGMDPFGFYTNPYDQDMLFSVGGDGFQQNVFNMGMPGQGMMPMMPGQQQMQGMGQPMMGAPLMRPPMMMMGQ